MRNLSPLFKPATCAAILVLVFAAGLLGACAAHISTELPTNQLRQLQIESQAGANSNTATAVDIVFVYEPSALPALPKGATEWFEKKQQMRIVYPSGLDVVSLELPPTSAVKDLPLPSRHRKAVEVLVYANYLTNAGQPAGKLNSFTCARIILAKVQADFTECKNEQLIAAPAHKDPA